MPRGDWRKRWLDYLREVGTSEEEMRKREQLSLESRDVIVATEQEEDDCSEDPLEETQLVGIEMQRMKGMTLKEPRASLEVKYLIIDLLELEGEEKKDVLQILEIKVQEERRETGWRKKEQNHLEDGGEK